jgi:hypothetical protein
MVTRTYKPPETIDLHNEAMIDEVLSVFNTWYVTGYQVLPEAGGSLDQDWRLMDDLTTLAAEFAHIKREVDKARNDGNATS